MAKKDAIEKQGPTSLAQYDYGEYEGAGFGNQTQEDFSIPFLGVLQDLSPLVKDRVGKVGQLFNTVTEEIFDNEEGIVFVPCLTQHVYVEWQPRMSGGNFVGIHELDDQVVLDARKNQNFGEFKVGENDLVETFYVYGVAVIDGAPQQMVIAFTSTKIKVYKKWMTRARTIQIDSPDGRKIRPPLFAHRYRIKGKIETNNFGEFANLSITLDGEKAEDCRLPIDDPIFQGAVSVLKMIEEGKAKAAHDTQQGQSSGVAAEEAF